MTPEKRLNQIEPFVAELSAQLDRVTAQNKQLITISLQHSDDVQFLLHEVGDVKLGQAKLEQGQNELTSRVDDLSTKFDGLEIKFDNLEIKFGDIETKVDGLSNKIDVIIDLLQAGNSKRSNE